MAIHARTHAKDLNGAMAGSLQPQPELNTVDELASQAGLDIVPGEPVNTYEIIKSRDSKRLESPSHEDQALSSNSHSPR